MKSRLSYAIWIMIVQTGFSIYQEQAIIFMISLLICTTYVAWPSMFRTKLRGGDEVIFVPHAKTSRDFIHNGIRDGLTRNRKYKVTAVNKENGLIKIEGGQLWHHPKQFFLSN